VFNSFEMTFNEFEMLFNHFELLFYVFEMLLNYFEMFFHHLSSGLINFVRSRDSVGEKSTKIRAAAFGRRSYKGGRRAKARRPLCRLLVFFSPTGSLERTKLIRLLLKSLKTFHTH